MSGAREQAVLDLLTKGWDGLLSGPGREVLQTTLPAWLVRQRWFGAKSRTVSRLQIAGWVEVPVTGAATILPTAGLPAASSLGDVLLLLDLTYSDGCSERYQLPLAYATGATLDAVRLAAPASLVCELESPTGAAAFHDSVVREEFCQALLALIEGGVDRPAENLASASEHIAATLVAAHESRPVHEVSTSATHDIAAAIEARHSIEAADVAPQFVGHMPGALAQSSSGAVMHDHATARLRGTPAASFAAARGRGALPARIGSAEQSNTNILYGERLILKLFRRLQPGLNPDIEIGRFLTEVAQFDRIPPLLGELALHSISGERTSLGMVQGLVANEGDGWSWTLQELARFFEAVMEAPAGLQVDPAHVKMFAGIYLDAVALLGRRTGELHLALAMPTNDPAFAAEPATSEDMRGDAARTEAQITAALDALERQYATLSGTAAVQARMVLDRRDDLLRRAKRLLEEVPTGQRIRIHGDYHLGQVLRTHDDFVLLDFEGEPARSLEERSRKQSPLRDVAGMLRSFAYAASTGLDAAGGGLRETLALSARSWGTTVSTVFLNSYLETAAQSKELLPEPYQPVLDAYLLEKVLYELLYELNNRPAWVGIPLQGILGLLDSGS